MTTEEDVVINIPPDGLFVFGETTTEIERNMNIEDKPSPEGVTFYPEDSSEDKLDSLAVSLEIIMERLEKLEKYLMPEYGLELDPMAKLCTCSIYSELGKRYCQAHDDTNIAEQIEGGGSGGPEISSRPPNRFELNPKT